MHGKAKRVRPVLVHHLEGIDDVALGLAHLLPVLVRHQGIDVDLLERHLPRELEPHHHHAGNPESEDIPTGDKHRGRIKRLQIGCLSRANPRWKKATKPTKTRYPTRPDLESNASPRRKKGKRWVRPRSQTPFAITTGVDRDAMAPPDLTANAPVLNVGEPTVVLVAPRFGRKLRPPIRHGLQGFLGKGFHLDEPLLGIIRLHDRAATVAMAHVVFVGLGLDQQSAFFQILPRCACGPRIDPCSCRVRHSRSRSRRG
jgi:hypothetical protein